MRRRVRRAQQWKCDPHWWSTLCLGLALWSKLHPLSTLMAASELLGIVFNFLLGWSCKRMIHSPMEQWLGEKGGSLGHSWSLDDHWCCPAHRQYCKYTYKYSYIQNINTHTMTFTYIQTEIQIPIRGHLWSLDDYCCPAWTLYCKK